MGTDILPAISLAFEEEETRHEVMKRGPRNPISEGLLDERVLFLSYGQNGLISAAAGFFTYFVISDLQLRNKNVLLFLNTSSLRSES